MLPKSNTYAKCATRNSTLTSTWTSIKRFTHRERSNYKAKSSIMCSIKKLSKLAEMYYPCLLIGGKERLARSERLAWSLWPPLVFLPLAAWLQILLMSLPRRKGRSPIKLCKITYFTIFPIRMLLYKDKRTRSKISIKNKKETSKMTCKMSGATLNCRLMHLFILILTLWIVKKRYFFLVSEDFQTKLKASTTIKWWELLKENWTTLNSQNQPPVRPPHRVISDGRRNGLKPVLSPPSMSRDGILWHI